MGRFWRAFATTMGVMIPIAAVLGAAGYYSTQWFKLSYKEVRDEVKKDVGGAVESLREQQRQRTLRFAQAHFAEQMGAEAGNELFERIAYLDTVFEHDEFNEVLDAFFAEYERQERSVQKGEEIDVLYALYLLNERAVSAVQKSFVGFLAANVEVFSLSRKAKPVVPSGKTEPEGENLQAISPKDTFYYSQIDATTGEPVSTPRNTTPGFVYAPQDPGADPGFNTRKATPGY
jgi:hypothetical protein